MQIEKELVELLRCPKCKGTLLNEAEKNAFICQTCKLVFPIIDGIPNFLLSEAKPYETV